MAAARLGMALWTMLAGMQKAADRSKQSSIGRFAANVEAVAAMAASSVFGLPNLSRRSSGSMSAVR